MLRLLSSIALCKSSSSSSSTFSAFSSSSPLSFSCISEILRNFLGAGAFSSDSSEFLGVALCLGTSSSSPLSFSCISEIFRNFLDFSSDSGDFLRVTVFLGTWTKFE
eukprot:TRINITY_DN2535_c0_g1_i1.p3 TRINITY_DN2535_c0_g1~~TRINITY_DN2535_c0_g1_i1.p3  ORF type:complete len:107 (+),score=3.91 TRINITY_DN2535_c0_g1_i1:198-518(+)